MDFARTLIVVPVYNESDQVLHETILQLLPTGARVVVVDDGSEDPVRLPIADGRLAFIRHPLNLGQGAALQTGMEYGRREPGIDYLVHFDADGQHAVEALPQLLDPLIQDEADIVFGSRFLLAEDQHKIPKMRRFVLRTGRIFNFLVTGVWMTDAHIGLRAMNRRAFERITFRENRMAYATELLWQIRSAGLRWREIPVSVTYSPYSRNKGQSSWNAFRIAGDVLLRMIYP